MKLKRHNGMRRRNGRNGCTPAAEPLEPRRMLSIVPLPAGGFQPYILENGTGSNWTIQNRNGTTNGLPVGGSRTNTGGLGVFSATFDTGHDHPFDFGHSIWVNDSIFIPPGGAVDSRGQVEVTGYKDGNNLDHWTRLSAGPAPMSGLNVGVEYYAAQQSATLRTLARFDNPGDAAVSANVAFVYNLGSDANTKITGTSDPDIAFTTADRWLVTDDIPATTGDAVPAVTGVLRGPGPSALAPSAVSNVVFNAAGTEGVLARYDITVPAGETRYLMFFTQLSLTSADALGGAHAFDEAPTATRTPFWDDMLAGINDAQYRQILNWASNTPPVANADGNADAYATDEDTPLEVPAPGVLAHDTDADGDAIHAVLGTGPTHGMLNLRPDGSFTYTPDKDYFGTGAAADSFTYRAVDPMGAASELTTVPIDVKPVNDAPVAKAGADGVADEGSVVSFAGSASDVDDAAGSLTYRWNFGDDSPQAEGASATHAYADDGTYTAVLTVTDPSGATATDELTVKVANVAPVATITGAPAGGVAEGTPLNLSVHVEDPGTVDPHTFQWTVVREGAVLASGTDPDFQFTPADNGEYDFAVSVTDDYAAGSDTVTVVVANAAPVATITGVPEVVTEGDPVTVAAEVFDPGTADTHTYQWTVARGGETIAGGTDPGLAFTPADEGEYLLTLTVTDNDGDVGTDSRTVVVANAAPTLSGLTLSPAPLDENGTTHLAGSVGDSGAGDVLTLSVDWADGSAADVVSLAPGASFDLSHAYLDDRAGAAADTYAVSITLTDGDGGAAATSATAAVNNVSPVVRDVTGPATGTPGQSLAYATTFTDAGTLDTHVASVDWGDGTTTSPATLTEPAGATAGTVSGAHAYAVAGTYTVTIVVVDDDGGASQSSTVVRVAAVETKPVEVRADPSYPGKTALYVLGGAGNDTVQINPSVQAGAVEVVLNGVNYGAFSPTSRIVVYAGAGDDTVLAAGAVNVVTWAYGEDGNDTLNLGNGGGLALGGNGNDQINGGSGRDILVGGEGADRIVSNPGDDILISAVTTYGNRFAAGHEQAWKAIYAEWSDTSRTFRQRVDNVRCGAGVDAYKNPVPRLNGNYFLNADTVIDDASVDVIGTQDVLTGASGEDWFIYKAGEDKVSTMSSAEACEDLTII